MNKSVALGGKIVSILMPLLWGSLVYFLAWGWGAVWLQHFSFQFILPFQLSFLIKAAAVFAVTLCFFGPSFDVATKYYRL